MKIGSGTYSIEHQGMALFAQPIESLFGSTTIDLASAAIEPGEHVLRIASVIGIVEIFLPRDARFTIEGGRFGGVDVHEGLGFWQRLRVRFGAKLLARAPTPAGPVMIHIVIEGVLGGLDIYRV